MIQFTSDSHILRLFRMFRICFCIMRKLFILFKANVFEGLKNYFFAFRMVSNLLIAKCYAVQH